MIRRNQAVLIILFAVFALPPLLSWYLFNYTELGTGGNATGHGTLITPPRPLPAWPLIDPADESGAQHRLHGKWTLIYPLTGECREACLRNVYKMRQLRLATGKHAGRVQRALLLTGGAPVAPASTQLLEYPGQMLLLPEDVNGEEALRALFMLTDGDQPFIQERLYLVDPLGNLMMCYSGDVEPGGIIEDLTRLLKYSRSG